MNHASRAGATAFFNSLLDLLVSEAMRELHELQKARSGLVRDRIALIQRRNHARLPLVRRIAAQSLRVVERQLAAIEAEIETRIAADPELVARQRILASIPSFGPAPPPPSSCGCRGWARPRPSRLPLSPASPR